MKKSVKLAVAGLAAVAVVGGTFAYWQADSVVDNQFNTKGFGGQTTEVFNPLDGQDWKPGAEVTKEVGVKNTGDYPIVARISFDEDWTRNDKSISDQYPMSSITEDGKTNANFFPDQGDKYVDTKSVVVKNLLEEGWIDGGDGYYYTTNVIAAGQSSGNLLTSVEMLNDTPMAEYADGPATTISTITVQRRDKDNNPVGDPVVYENASMEVTEGGEGTSTYQQVTITYKEGEETKTVDIKATDNAVITREAEQELVSEGFANAKYSLKIHTEYSQVATNNDGTNKTKVIGTTTVPVGMLWDTNATTN